MVHQKVQRPAGAQPCGWGADDDHMILTRSTSLVTVSLFCLVAMPASGALGATKKKKSPVRPTVRAVAPMKAGVGDQLTIKGRNFVLGKNRNTVFFKAGSRPAVSTKAIQATRTSMKVVIPKSLEKYITVKDGVAQPTRVRLRVLSKRFAKGTRSSGCRRASPSATRPARASAARWQVRRPIATATGFPTAWIRTTTTISSAMRSRSR